MKFFLTIFLFLFISSSGFASRGLEERQFIEKVEHLTLEQLNQLKSDFRDKQLLSFSEEQLQFKIIEFYIYFQKNEPLKRIEILIWFTNNKEIKNKEYLTWAHYHLSTTLSYYTIFDLAIEQNLICIDFAKKTQNAKMLYLAYSNLGSIYFKEHKYTNSRKYFELAQQTPHVRPVYMRASDNNNIGLCYHKLQNYPQAVKVFQKALSLFKEPVSDNNEEVYYLVLGNLGATYIQNGKTDKGIHLLKQELEYYERSHLNNYNKASCLMDIIHYHNLKNETHKLPGLIEQTLDIIVQLPEVELRIQSIEKLIRLIHEEGIRIDELKLNKVYNTILIQSNKEFQTIQASISKLLYEEKITSLITHSKLEKRTYNLQQKNSRLFLYVSLVIVVSLLLLLIGIIHNNKQRLIRSQQALLIQQQKEEIFQNEQTILQQQFQNQKLQMNSLLTNLSIKQKTESGFLEKIKELKRKKNLSTEQIIQELQLSVNNLIDIDRKLINESISNFELNPEFSSGIQQKHPELTELEIRYCNYFIAGLSSKEIGLLHNLSDVSVRVLKNKIKKKLGLDKDESMIDYLKKFIH